MSDKKSKTPKAVEEPPMTHEELTKAFYDLARKHAALAEHIKNLEDNGQILSPKQASANRRYGM